MEETQKKSKISKKIVIPLLAILLIGIVSAIVYTYVSNTVTLQVNITAPTQVWFGSDETQTVLDLGIVTTADPINFIINERNNANNPIQIYNVLLEVTSNNDFIGTEFDSIVLTDNVGHIGLEVLPYIKFIKADGSYDNFANIGTEHTKVAKLMLASNGATLEKFTFNPASVHTSDITIQPDLGAINNYQIKICDVYNLVGASCQ